MAPTDGTVLVLGGRSEIGTAVAVRLAALGCGTFVLAARRTADLDGQEAALRRAGAETVGRVEFDADDLGSHEAVLTEVADRFGPPSRSRCDRPGGGPVRCRCPRGHRAGWGTRSRFPACLLRPTPAQVYCACVRNRW